MKISPEVRAAMKEVARKYGRQGGKKAAQSLTPEERVARARKASLAAARKRTADRLAREAAAAAGAKKRTRRWRAGVVWPHRKCGIVPKCGFAGARGGLAFYAAFIKGWNGSRPAYRAASESFARATARTRPRRGSGFEAPRQCP